MKLYLLYDRRDIGVLVASPSIKVIRFERAYGLDESVRIKQVRSAYELNSYFGCDYLSQRATLDEFKQWVKNCKRTDKLCDLYGIKRYKRPSTPQDWGFTEKDFKKYGKACWTFFEHICTMPRERWFD